MRPRERGGGEKIRVNDQRQCSRLRAIEDNNNNNDEKTFQNATREIAVQSSVFVCLTYHNKGKLSQSPPPGNYNVTKTLMKSRFIKPCEQ